MKRLISAAGTGIFLLLLTSCQGKSEVNLPTNTASLNKSEIYPVPQKSETYSISQQSETYPVPQDGISPYPIEEGGQIQPILITPNPPLDAPEPEAGKASISGTLYSPIQKMVIPVTQFYLTLGWGEDHSEMPPAFVGPQVDKGDINLMSDSQGNFSVNDIPPGNYYLVVWAPLTWDVAQISDIDTQPLLLELKPDQNRPLGIVYISWP
jgi:hypothetical protein